MAAEPETEPLSDEVDPRTERALAVEELLAGLNPPQREAVTYGDGPLLILAGAGSGKTRVLTHRIAYLVRTDRARAGEILAITFTNKAAQEMRERVELLLGRRTRAMWVMTFHSACARMLRAEAPRLGYTKSFTIYDQADSRRQIKRCIDDLGVDPKRYTPAAIGSQISDAKNKLRDADAYRQMVGSFFEQTVADVYDLYEREMHRANAMDFDDLLVRAVNVLELFPEVRERYANAFRHVLVDEYQDTNHAQYRWLQLLAGEHRNLAVVGDDDQCLVAGTLVTMADGTRRPIEDVRVGDEVLSCYGSGDFRPARVTRTFEALRDDLVRIKTRDGREIVSTPEHVHFAGYRTNSIPDLYMTYLMRRRDMGCRVGVTRTYRNGQPRPILGLAMRTAQERADESWVISTHASEGEARAAETLISLRYQIPTLPFLARQKAADRSLIGDQRLLDRIFADTDSETGAVRLLHDERLWPEDPHHLARTYEGRRRNVVVTLCADRRGHAPLHLVTVGGRDTTTHDRLRGAGFTVTPPNSRLKGWRHEAVFADFGQLMKHVARLREAVDVNVRLVARLGRQQGERNTLPFMHASSVRRGMAMFTADGDYDMVESVELLDDARAVHDINVEGTHNFVANGLVTHNSVYGFRGADIQNILGFQDDFPDAHAVRLEQNYRSTQTILSVANAVVSHNRGRMAKSLWTDLGQGDPVKVREMPDEHAEARYVAGEIERLVDQGVSREEVAVFYRTNAQSRVLEDTLVRAEIGYQVIGGTKFYERAEIKDAIAYLNWLVNPQDIGAFSRIANSPRRGIGQTSLGRVIAHANTTGEPIWDVASTPSAVPALGTAAVRAFERFMGTMHVLRERVDAGAAVAQVLDETLHETGYLEALEAERTIEAQGRIENLQELVEVAREYDAGNPEGTLADFLQQISLVTDTDQLRDDEGLLTLMTLHNAKGLEFPIVFMIGMEDGVFPHSRALDEGGLEEERRLCYVGITRAQRDLYLTYARQRTLFGAREYGLRSRFLDEIPDELTDEERAAPDTQWSGGGRLPGEPGEGWSAPGADEPAPAAYRLGDEVVHAAFGDGVVTGVEPGGIVVVHFAGDGSERKLVAAYAPITKR
jgi:DNA helicase II / ATP-dependent DNA helicase PcrA